MKIHLERSGGFAGITSSTTVDSKALTPNDANELQNLIQKSNLFERSASSAQQSKSQQSDSQQPSPNTKAKTNTKAKKGAADYFTYKITIQNGNKEQSMECNDVDMQTDVKGLVDFVTKHGQK
jgi:hypothetical protein